jgi:hypothetical protein
MAVKRLPDSENKSDESARRTNLRRFVASSRNVILALHAVAAICWWLLMPHGFPAGHLRFWANDVVPLLLLGGSIAGILVNRVSDFRVNPVMVGLAGGWLGFAIAARLIFPISGARYWWIPLLIGVVHVVNEIPEIRARRVRHWSSAAAGTIGLALGALTIWAQRAELSSSRPLNVSFATMDGPLMTGDVALGEVVLSDRVTVAPIGELVKVRTDSLDIHIRPMLYFESVSPDRCWTIFAPRSTVMNLRREASAMTVTPKGVAVGYGDVARLEVAADEEGETVDITSYTRLTAPVYSHLNSWCELFLTGPGVISLAFSPCDVAPVEVLQSDYPVGRPARLAYLDSEQIFHVVEAKSGEKGPFRSLAKGRLPRGEPLTITVFVDGVSCCGMTLKNWSSQISTQISPTAGWGLPVNAIEFHRISVDEVMISLTLAGTSVGRGWDSVGHSAGTYCEKLTLRTIHQ